MNKTSQVLTGIIGKPAHVKRGADFSDYLPDLTARGNEPLLAGLIGAGMGGIASTAGEIMAAKKDRRWWRPLLSAGVSGGMSALLTAILNNR